MNQNLHYLVDGYNLFFFLSQENPSTQLRFSLIESLEAVTYIANLSVSIVFDSREDVASDSGNILDYKSLEIIYSAKNQSADEYILEYLYALKEPKDLCVVTNDKAIVQAAKESMVSTMNLSMFLSLLHKKRKQSLIAKKEPCFSDKEHTTLLKIFENRYHKDE